MVKSVNDVKALTAERSTSNAKVALVYDLTMPKYQYRDEQGESVTVDLKAPRETRLRSEALSNLALA